MALPLLVKIFGKCLEPYAVRKISVAIPKQRLKFFVETMDSPLRKKILNVQAEVDLKRILAACVMITLI